MSKIEINLSKRDKKRLLKYCDIRLNILDIDETFKEVDIECYKEGYYFNNKKTLRGLLNELSKIRKDKKMFNKIKKVLNYEKISK